MSVVYAESSAVLTWLLDEPRHSDVIQALGGADYVVTSALTAIECARGLARARHAERISAAGERTALRALNDAAVSWHVMDIGDAVSARARAGFPLEPVRTLDAVHLATALAFDGAVGTVTVLSLDDRVRDNARALGMAVGPE